MILPVTDETTWLRSLHHAQEWMPPSKITVIVSPHPDDETLGAGGLIAAQRRRGVPVIVVAVTDGEAAYPDSPRLGPVRRVEQEKALAELGVDDSEIIRLSLPDSDVASREAELAGLLGRLVAHDFLLVAPWRFDRHPDHEASGRAAERVAIDKGATLVSYFFWSWHYDQTKTLTSLPLRRFYLDRKLEAAKAIALSRHESQLEHSSGSPILPELLLSPARRPFETFLVQ